MAAHREIVSVARGATLAHRLLRGRVAFLVVATLLVDVAGTLLAYAAEHGRPRSDIATLGDALFWTSAQLTTVSSQMANPVTTGGRVLDLVLEVWAISVVATLAGALGAFFRSRHDERLDATKS